MRILLALTALVLSSNAYTKDDFTISKTYEELVDPKGKISLPKNYRSEWVFLGTWSVAEKDVERSSEASGHGAAGLHNVYTQPESVTHYQRHGEFPDGAVLVKELLKGETAQMTTGTVSRGGEVEGWFIMVKDRQNRFDSNPLWGDGWGWSLFNMDQQSQTVTKDYKMECIGCHIPAQSTDWVYVNGYPILEQKSE